MLSRSSVQIFENDNIVDLFIHFVFIYLFTRNRWGIVIIDTSIQRRLLDLRVKSVDHQVFRIQFHLKAKKLAQHKFRITTSHPS